VSTSDEHVDGNNQLAADGRCEQRRIVTDTEHRVPGWTAKEAVD